MGHAADYGDSLHLLPTMIFECERGDSKAINTGFVFALRSYGIPAQLNLGFKSGQSVLDMYGVPVINHAQSEFYAEGIGWIPWDASSGLELNTAELVGSETPSFWPLHT